MMKTPKKARDIALEIAKEFEMENDPNVLGAIENAEKEGEDHRMHLLREKILKVFLGKTLKKDADLALVHCLDFIRDTAKVEKIAEDIGLTLTGFKRNENLEFYYDIERSGKSISSISKGWGDPGFRILDVWLCKPENINAFKSNAEEAFNLCAAQGVALGFRKVPGGLGLEFYINIFQDGLNASVLKNALVILEFTINKLKLLLNQH